jgi:uncharacterized membrane protein HdeD (DUF308 family)
MSARLAHNWWAVGLRGVAAVAFGLAFVTLLPSSTTPSLVRIFAAYIAAVLPHPDVTEIEAVVTWGD